MKRWVGNQRFRASILALELLRTLRSGQPHAADLRPLVVDGRGANGVLARQISELRAAFGSLLDPDDVGLGESDLTHGVVPSPDGSTPSSEELLGRPLGLPHGRGSRSGTPMQRASMDVYGASC